LFERRVAARRSVSRRIAGCDADRLFSIIADVERYPEFVPGCISMRIMQRRERSWVVDNVFGIGPFRCQFRSAANLDPPLALTINSRDGPWRFFSIEWRLRPEDTACSLSFAVVLEFKSPLLGALTNFAATEFEQRVIAAFEARVRSLSKGERRER